MSGERKPAPAPAVACSLAAHRDELIQAALASGAELEECEVLLRHILGREAVPDLEPLLDRWIHLGTWTRDDDEDGPR